MSSLIDSKVREDEQKEQEEQAINKEKEKTEEDGRVGKYEGRGKYQLRKFLSMSTEKHPSPPTPPSSSMSCCLSAVVRLFRRRMGKGLGRRRHRCKSVPKLVELTDGDWRIVPSSTEMHLPVASECTEVVSQQTTVYSSPFLPSFPLPIVSLSVSYVCQRFGECLYERTASRIPDTKLYY